MLSPRRETGNYLGQKLGEGVGQQTPHQSRYPHLMTTHLHILIEVMKARHIGGPVTHHQVCVVAFKMGDDLWAGRQLVKKGPGNQDNCGLAITKAAAWPHWSTCPPSSAALPHSRKPNPSQPPLLLPSPHGR